MKREIKFRAYYPYGDGDWIMIYNVQNSYVNIGNVTDEHGKLACDPETCFADFIQGQDNGVELMQYTNLHDKNGREIYEGDILDIGLRNQDGKPVIAPVSYETYAAGYVLDNGGNGIWQRLTEDCEVIGNIFENPELLEGKQKND